MSKRVGIRSLLQNPFFVREHRQALRRQTTPAKQLTLTLCVPALVLLAEAAILMPGMRSGSTVRMFSPWWLLLPHLLLCGSFVFGATHRMIAEEVRLDTLEQVLLVPLSPWEWLLGKMAYPAALVIVLGLAPLPLFLCAAVLGWVSPSAMLRGLPIVSLLLISLVPAGFLASDTRVNATSAAPVAEAMHRVGRSVRSLLQSIGSVSVTAAAVVEIFRPFRVVRTFGLEVPPWLPLGLCAVAIALAGIYAGRSILLRTTEADREFPNIGYAVLALIYFVAVGLFWEMMPWWGRLAALLAGPALAVLDYRQNVRGSTRYRKTRPAWMARELRLAERIFPNPLLLLELGRVGRVCPLHTALLVGGFAVIVPVVVVGWSRGHQGYLTLLNLIFMYILMAGGAVSRRWEQDRHSGFLESIFLTPQSSAALVRGRLLAHAAVQGSSLMGMILGYCLLLGWNYRMRAALPIWLAMILLSVLATPWAAGRILASAGESRRFGSSAVHVLWFLLFTLPTSMFCAMAAWSGRLAPGPFWLCGAGIVLVNMLVTRSLFASRVREMEYLRAGGD